MARRRRCTGWVPVNYPSHKGMGHVPVGAKDGHACRRCWVPCKNKTDGGAYCQECLDRLSVDARAVVRRSLASDPETPEDTLNFLTEDGEEVVAYAARQELHRRGLTDEQIMEHVAASNTGGIHTIGEDDIVDPWAGDR